MNKNIIFILMIFSFIVLVGCDTQKEVIPAPKMEEPTALQPLSPKPSWQVEWEKTLATGKKEKVVSVWSATGGITREVLIKAFKNEFNIDVQWITGRPGELQTKLQTERNAGLYTVDVIQAGGAAHFWMKDRGFLIPMEKFLILPEVKEAKNWYRNRLQWMDEKDNTILTYGSFVVSFIAIDNNVIQAGDIKDIKDIFHPKWKGKISLSDPTVFGIGMRAFGVLGDFVLGWDYFRELAKQEPMITSDTRLQVEWLANGKYPIALSARPESMAEFKQAGAKINYINVKDGAFLTIGGSTHSILDKAPNPNASVVFTNWILGKEAQTIYSKNRGFESFRLDVPNDHLDFVRDPKIEYVYGDTPDVYAKEVSFWPGKAREIFGTLLR